jgi:putative transposase
MAMVTKTVKLGIHRNIHEIKRKAILNTQIVYNRVIACYMDFFVAHLGVFDENVIYTKKNGETAMRHWTHHE